jgi:hypothetical protein
MTLGIRLRDVKVGLAAAMLSVVALTIVDASAATPDWSPESSEQLVKLPSSLIKKSLDRDFLDSSLGRALSDTDTALGDKTRTLQDLKAAIARADGEVELDLRHQFLGEKRDWLDLMSRRTDLRRLQVETELKVFEGMLARLNRDNAAMTPAREQLIARQEGARQRLESSIAQADQTVFESAAPSTSRYSSKYAENMAAIENLVAAISRHPMNPEITGAGVPMSKAEAIRGMLVRAQAERAILEQEETVLGYMAKLVALDALALSEQALDAELADSDLPGRDGPADMVGLFAN